MTSGARSCYVSPEGFLGMLEGTPHPGDRALLVSLYASGMTLSEVARFHVSHVFDVHRKPKSCAVVGSDVSLIGSPRRVYWPAWSWPFFEVYLKWRMHVLSASRKTLHQGDRFIVDLNGSAYPDRLMKLANGRVYANHSDLSQRIRLLHHAAGFPSGNAESARRSYSAWLAQGLMTGSPMHPEWIQVLRGDRLLSATRAAIAKDVPVGFDPIAQLMSSSTPLFKGLEP